MAEREFSATFQALKAVLQEFEPRLVKVHDEADHYYLDTAHVQKNRKPLFFGAVRTTRKYVGFHLMPVYIWPELLDDVSATLRSRMQGKSCFNFATPDPELLAELASLAERGFDKYRDAGYVAEA